MAHSVRWPIWWPIGHVASLAPLSWALCVAGGNDEAHRREGSKSEGLLHASNDADDEREKESETSVAR